MYKKIIINETELSKNKTNICIPIAAKTEAEILNDLELAIVCKADLIEWRADFFNESEDPLKILDILSKIKSNTTKPLIFTLRGFEEGGYKKIYTSLRKKIIISVIESKLTEIIDIEMNNDISFVTEIINTAHKNNIYVILSNHDFHTTPPKSEIISRLFNMEKMNADIAKIAVMPNNFDDILSLLDAANEANKTISIPIAAMSMGKPGAISRISANLFGSCITFGTAGNSSAPGQIPAEKLRDILALFEEASE